MSTAEYQRKEAIQALAKAVATTLADQEEETGQGITADQVNMVADGIDRLVEAELGTSNDS